MRRSAIVAVLLCLLPALRLWAEQIGVELDWVRFIKQEAARSSSDPRTGLKVEIWGLVTEVVGNPIPKLVIYFPPKSYMTQDDSNKSRPPSIHSAERTETVAFAMLRPIAGKERHLAEVIGWCLSRAEQEQVGEKTYPKVYLSWPAVGDRTTISGGYPPTPPYDPKTQKPQAFFYYIDQQDWRDQKEKQLGAKGWGLGDDDTLDSGDSSLQWDQFRHHFAQFGGRHDYARYLAIQTLPCCLRPAHHYYDWRRRCLSNWGTVPLMYKAGMPRFTNGVRRAGKDQSHRNPLLDGRDYTMKSIGITQKDLDPPPTFEDYLDALGHGYDLFDEERVLKAEQNKQRYMEQRRQEELRVTKIFEASGTPEAIVAKADSERQEVLRQRKVDTQKAIEMRFESSTARRKEIMAAHNQFSLARKEAYDRWQERWRELKARRQTVPRLPVAEYNSQVKEITNHRDEQVKEAAAARDAAIAKIKSSENSKEN